jgi:hypothetical protein
MDRHSSPRIHGSHDLFGVPPVLGGDDEGDLTGNALDVKMDLELKHNHLL